MDLNLRQEAMRRLATHLDLPPELQDPEYLDALPDVTAMAYEAQAAELADLRAHLTRELAPVLDEITVDYLRPALAEAGVDNPEAFAIRLELPEA